MSTAFIDERHSLALVSVTIQPGTSRQFVSIRRTFAPQYPGKSQQALAQLDAESSIPRADTFAQSSQARHLDHATRESNIRESSHNKVPAHSNVAQIAKAITSSGHSGRRGRVSSSLTTETCIWSRSARGIAITISVRFEGRIGITPPNGRKDCALHQ